MISLKNNLKNYSARILNKDLILVIVVLTISLALFLFADKVTNRGSIPVIAEVIQVEDRTKQVGIIKLGEQKVKAEILTRRLRGRHITVTNKMIGHLMMDHPVAPGDRALFMLDLQEDSIKGAKLVDYDRQTWHLRLFVIFAVVLILFARYTGFKAFVSFIFTMAVLVKVLLPAILKGYDPLFVSVSLAVMLASVTLLLIGGFRLRTLAAVTGVTIGMMLSTILTVFAGQAMQISGITNAYAARLLLSGYAHLDLDRIFWGAVILSISGALLDIAISSAATVAEVIKANPSLSLRRLIGSGFAVGQAELGTMVSTLLLAYTGYSFFLILALSASDITFTRFLNISVISALILKVLAGSIGMVLVAPITAVTAGLLYHRFHGTPVETAP